MAASARLLVVVLGSEARWQGACAQGTQGRRLILFPAVALQADGSAASMVVEVQGAWSGKEGQGSGVALYRAREEGEGPAQGERRRGRARVRH